MRLMALYNLREDCLLERKLAGVLSPREMGSDIGVAEEVFIEQAEAAATA
jgi:hypothetical protein